MHQQRTSVGEANRDGELAEAPQRRVAPRAQALRPALILQQRKQRALPLVADHVAQETRRVLRPEVVQGWDDPAQAERVTILDRQHLDEDAAAVLWVRLARVQAPHRQLCMRF